MLGRKFMWYLFLVSCSLQAGTWKVFFYMDASDGLTDMAFKNITDIMRGKMHDTHNNVDVVIQLHAYDQVALRYHVTDKGLVFVEEKTLSTNCSQDFVDALIWAFQAHTSDHTMLILSNHGYGALDPQWNESTKKWEVEGINLSNIACQTCQLPPKKSFKGFMFNGISHTYLTNQELEQGLAYMYETLFQQKKIDIVAFDTCMGSMLEVATCVAPYVHYLVGVQSCASIDGFDYQGCMSVLNQGQEPRQASAQFVEKFDAYYSQHDEKEIYTCASLDLKQISDVNESVNVIVSQIMQHQEFLPLLNQARSKCHRFCLWPIYTDMVAYWKLVETELLKLPASEHIKMLIAALHDCYRKAQSMVIARCGGTTTQGNAYGFSIYLPPHKMEPSYGSHIFSQYSQWPMLVKMLCLQDI